MTIKQILENGVKLLKENSINDALLKSKILLCYILNVEKEYLIIHNKEEMAKEDVDKFNTYIKRLINREPLQYITNKQEFMGLEFYVDKSVLIPQPDTEILVEETINICKKINNEKLDLNTVGGDAHIDPHNNIKILDLCTGSGAIGISIAKNIENCEMTLSDISKEALKIAQKNCVGVDAHIDPRIKKQKTNNKIKIIQSDLFENIKDKFDIIVSNPPYIKTDVIKTLQKEVQKEPILALNGGKDGLDIYRRIINEAYKYLNEDGYLCLEIGYDQKDEVIRLIKETGKYKNIYSKKDLSGNDRIVICKKEN
ncbi:MAG: peptide chain release factor N(5)-glutamine methyltransferase [Clostridia bacterium]|nr:peptide chain release factor N(5)-glutamine methyltransferase [Clostridia bacterium]